MCVILITDKIIAEQNDTLFLSSELIADGRVFIACIDGGSEWNYRSGDNMKWADVDLDDNDWVKIDPWIDALGPDADKWQGIGWFRKIIKIDSSLINKTVGIEIHHDGASDIFINEKKVYSFGKVASTSDGEEIYDPSFVPYVINFDTSTVYTFAVRYSNHSYIDNQYFYNKFFGHIGFCIELFSFENEIEEEINILKGSSALTWGMHAFTLAFSIIFFLLYFFYSKRRENLFFAFFVFGMAIFNFSIGIQNFGSPDNLLITAFFRFLQFAGVSVTFISLLLFFYQVVYKKISNLFWVFLIAFFAINLFSFIGSEGIFDYMMPLMIVVILLLIEGGRVMFVGVIKKIRYIQILATGTLVFTIFFISANILPEFVTEIRDKHAFIYIFLNIITFISLPISMAIYLAKSYSQTHNDLEEQIITVKALSKKQIEQERTNAELKLKSELEKKESERKSYELEQARKLQLLMLPKEIPSLPNLDIAVYMKPATEVGGDYYDFYTSDKNALTTVIGDATGHGLNAGMLVSITKGLFQNFSVLTDLEQSFELFNKSLFSMGLQPLLMSLSAVRITNYQLDIINAGMPGLLLYDKEKNIVSEIEASGPPLGVVEKYPYIAKKIKFTKGNVLLLMSDGFTERLNEKEDMLGCEKCKKTFKESAVLTSEEIISKLVAKELEWGGDRKPDDDITFIVIKCK